MCMYCIILNLIQCSIIMYTHADTYTVYIPHTYNHMLSEVSRDLSHDYSVRIRYK